MAKERESKVDFWLTEDGLVLLEAWSRDGNTFSEIADKIGVTRFCLSNWRKRYPEIHQALSTKKEVVDYKVENALLKRALGYTTKEIKVTVGKKVINGEVFQVLKETTIKEVAPDVSAAMSWLNNRQFDKWKKNRDRVMELDEEDSNVTINIVRGPKKDGLGDNVNQEVEFKTNENKRPAPKVMDEDDKDYWPEDWEDEE